MVLCKSFEVLFPSSFLCLLQMLLISHLPGFCWNLVALFSSTPGIFVPLFAIVQPWFHLLDFPLYTHTTLPRRYTGAFFRKYKAIRRSIDLFQFQAPNHLHIYTESQHILTQSQPCANIFDERACSFFPVLTVAGAVDNPDNNVATAMRIKVVPESKILNLLLNSHCLSLNPLLTNPTQISHSLFKMMIPLVLTQRFYLKPQLLPTQSQLPKAPQTFNPMFHSLLALDAV